MMRQSIEEERVQNGGGEGERKKKNVCLITLNTQIADEASSSPR